MTRLIVPSFSPSLRRTAVPSTLSLAIQAGGFPSHYLRSSSYGHFNPPLQFIYINKPHLRASVPLWLLSRWRPKQSARCIFVRIAQEFSTTQSCLLDRRIAAQTDSKPDGNRQACQNR